MRLPGTTPSAPDDGGECDPRLAEALAGGSLEQVAAVMLTVRLLVPVVAIPSPEGDAEMAVPALVAGDGRRALPVFSSYAALRRWRPDARPVPMPGARVFAGAAGEGYDGVVLDVAGPASHTLTGPDLAAVAAAAQTLAEHPDATVQALPPESPPDPPRP